MFVYVLGVCFGTVFPPVYFDNKIHSWHHLLNSWHRFFNNSIFVDFCRLYDFVSFIFQKSISLSNGLKSFLTQKIFKLLSDFFQVITLINLELFVTSLKSSSCQWSLTFLKHKIRCAVAWYACKTFLGCCRLGIIKTRISIQGKNDHGKYFCSNTWIHVKVPNFLILSCSFSRYALSYSSEEHDLKEATKRCFWN